MTWLMAPKAPMPYNGFSISALCSLANKLIRKWFLAQDAKEISSSPEPH